MYRHVMISLVLLMTVLQCGLAQVSVLQTQVTTVQCGSGYSCMRYPPGCVTGGGGAEDCTSLLKWKNSASTGFVEIQLMAKTKGYVALGLSNDSFMGNDSVMQCVSNSSNSGLVDVGFSYNYKESSGRRYNVDLQPSAVMRTLQNASASFTGSEIHCTFTRDVSADGDKIFALNSAYYLLLAFGTATNGTKDQHGVNPTVSSDRVDMTKSSLNLYSGSDDTSAAGAGLLTDGNGNTVQFGVTDDGKNVKFTLNRQLSSPGAFEWMALAFSNDGDMNEDSVVECVKLHDGKVVARNSYNGIHINNPSNPTDVGIIGQETSSTDGSIQCSFLRPVAGVNNHDVFPLNKPYRPLMAWGQVNNDGSKQQHGSNARKVLPAMVDFTSKNATNLNATSSAGPCITCLKRAHGILMITAWVLLVSTSIIIARYYKNAYGEKKLCAADVWFSLHRFLMLLALACTIAAFIIIFYVKKGKISNYPSGSPSYFWVHAPLGIVVMILVILNPLMAAFRCHPNTKYRPIYNWMHWFVGTCAHVISLITIFFGIKIGELGPEKLCHMAVFWIMIAFVGFHVLIEIILSIDKCVQEARSKQSFQVQYEMSKPGEMPRVVEPSVGSCRVIFRHIVLTFYFLVVLGLWLGMIILIGSGKIN